MADFKRPWGYLGKRRYYFYPTLYSFSFMYITRQLHNVNPFYYVTSRMLILTTYLKIKTKECNKISSHIKKDSYVICLDLKGKEFTSEEFSKKIDTLSLESSNLTFIIGGSLGLTEDLLQKSNLKICFSKGKRHNKRSKFFSRLTFLFFLQAQMLGHT